MSKRVVRLQVVETPADHSGPEDQFTARDLLPWADPYIARLMVAHRLECAMADRAAALNPQRPDTLPIDRFRKQGSDW